jgi:hypothetical protein
VRRTQVMGLAMALLASAAACETSGGADVEVADGATETSGDADGDGTPDADADATLDVAKDVAPDSDTEVGVCSALVATAQSALVAAGAGCASPSACSAFEYPICGSIGCFQGAVRKDADLGPLDAAATAAGAAGCEPFHCGCGAPPGAPLCLGGTCRLCPPDCGTDCGALETAFKAAAADAAAGCVHDLDCQITSVNPCALGPHLACHTLAWRSDPSIPLRLLDGYLGAAGCPDDPCDCQHEGARCEAGVCVPAPTPAVKCGTSVDQFPEFADDCSDVAQCALVTHTTDCCGNSEIWGLRANEVPAFNNAEGRCRTQMASCDCPALPPVAEDGQSAATLSDFAVRCEAGHCQSYAKKP